jgi:6-phosphogluconolactonase (cycloisomerase 2 family)
VEVGSGSCSAPASSSGYFYILDTATSQVIAYDINAGALTEVAAYSLPYKPIAIAVAPNNNYLYVSTLNGIFLYTISNGALTLGSTTPVTSDPALAMQVDATNSWLVEASGLGDLYAVPITPSTGQLSSVIATCYVPLNTTTVDQLAISPNNDYVFVAGGTSGTAAFGFIATHSNAPSGPFGAAAYATIPPANNSGGGALSVAVDPSNRLLYIGESDAVSNSGGLRAFTIGAGGGLTEISGSPLASGGTAPRSILPKSTGDYVYVANWKGTSAGNVTGFSITASGSSFSLTNLNNPVATGVEPTALVEDSTAQFALAVSQGGNPYFDAYTFDATTAGQLDSGVTSSAFAGSSIAAQH